MVFMRALQVGHLASAGLPAGPPFEPPLEAPPGAGLDEPLEAGLEVFRGPSSSAKRRSHHRPSRRLEAVFTRPLAHLVHLIVVLSVATPVKTERIYARLG